MKEKLSALWLVSWFGSAMIWTVGFSAPSFQLSKTLKSPAWNHLLGFDAFGRDLLGSTLRASVRSSTFAIIAVAAAVAGGMILGSSAVLAPKTIRISLLRALDFSLSFPSLLIALGWAAIRGPSWSTLLIALLIEAIPSLGRLSFLRAEELMKEEYVEASSALGAKPSQLLARHFFPALFSLSLLKAPRLFAYCLLAESMLSFLGAGAPIGSDTWGSLLAQGKDYLIESPHIAVGTGLPLIFTVLAIQILFEKDWR